MSGLGIAKPASPAGRPQAAVAKPQAAQPQGARPQAALLVSNAGQAGDGGIVDRAIALLGREGVRCAFVRQRGEPKIDQVTAAVAAAREAGCEVVVGLGGGSAIDLAKAAAGLMANGGGPLDYMEGIGQGRPITHPAAPWLAVPTTAGTGAEVTRNAVLCDPRRRVKASMRSELLLPSAVLVDAELAAGVRPEITAWSGMDALCQLIESYTSVRAQPITDALSARGIALAARSLRRAFTDGGDLAAREDMALSALLSGMTLTNVGLGAVHGFAGPLGGHLPIPHGVVCAALLPPVIAANAAAMRAESAEHPGLAKYADVGRMLAGDASLAGPAATEAAVRCAAELAAELEIPPLGRFGLTEEDVGDLVSLAQKASSMRYNPVTLSREALEQILRQAL